MLIEDGIVKRLETKAFDAKGVTVVDAKDCFISPGWIDLYATVPDPGAEHKETLSSLQNAAAIGGFTTVCVQPDDTSNRKSRSDIESGINRSQGKVTDLKFMGMVENSSNADNLNELMDMKRGGAIGFSNGKKGYQNPGLLGRALLYTKPYDVVLASVPRNLYYGQLGVVNESEVTVHAGLKTDPAVGEFTEVYRQVELARYHNRPLHLSLISTKESVDLIAKAKKEGVQVTCDVSIMNLCFTDESVLSYDTRFKTLPPLRSKSDRKALIKGLKTGVIDAIVSDHSPEDTESKRIEFDFAEPGCATIQTMYSFYHKYLSKEMEEETFMDRLTLGPAQVLGVECNLCEAKTANLTVVSPNKKWMFNRDSNHSLSQNNPLFGEELIGKPIFTLRGRQHWFDQ